jgi:hypothetical protein
MRRGNGEFDVTLGIFQDRGHTAETAFRVDPMCLWERATRVGVRRLGRPLATFLDQPVRFMRIESDCAQARESCGA